ncbi:nucleotidyltransferase domain-containing protein [Patescibacteria group bacterium]|nr:nucleotidyltransferase domain-containing protein [Patescibacteria group bacterium]
MNQFDHLVLLTLTYSSCFNFALSENEVARRLVKGEKKLFFSRNKIKVSLKKLLEQSLIQSDGQYFYLEANNLLNRKSKAKFVESKKADAKEFVKLAQRVPFVKAIVLTGSTAVGNAGKNDDLDFMIICQNNTLWITRFLLVILTKLKNKRPGIQESSSWCLNLWLDENDLAMGKQRRSLYEAYEILQMKFIFDRGSYEQLFLNANQWLKKHLFFYDNFKFGRYKREMSFSLFNRFMFIIQKLYRQIIFGKENFSLGPTQAFFNEISFKEKLFGRLEKKLDEIGKQTISF